MVLDWLLILSARSFRRLTGARSQSRALRDDRHKDPHWARGLTNPEAGAFNSTPDQSSLIPLVPALKYHWNNWAASAVPSVIQMKGHCRGWMDGLCTSTCSIQISHSGFSVDYFVMISQCKHYCLFKFWFKWFLTMLKTYKVHVSSYYSTQMKE